MGLDSILLFPLPLRFVIMCVIFVEFTKYFLNTHLQCPVQELYILFDTLVQDAVDAFCQVRLDFWSKCHLHKLNKEAWPSLLMQYTIVQREALCRTLMMDTIKIIHFLLVDNSLIFFICCQCNA